MQPPAPCLPFIEERNVVGHRGLPEGLSWGFPSSEIFATCWHGGRAGGRSGSRERHSLLMASLTFPQRQR